MDTGRPQSGGFLQGSVRQGTAAVAGGLATLFVRGGAIDPAVGENCAPGLVRGDAAGPSLAFGDGEGECVEDILRVARKGAGCVVAIKGHKGPGVGSAVVRAQVYEAAVKARVSKDELVLAHDSKGSVVSAQVSEGTEVEAYEKVPQLKHAPFRVL